MEIRHKDFVKTKRFKAYLRKFDFSRLLRKRLPSILEVKSRIKLDNAVVPSKKFKTGDVLDLTYLDLGGRKIRKFTGLCISVVNRGNNLRYCLRNVFSNIPVELSFDGYSPSIVSLGKAQIYKSVSKSRSKFYYLRGRRATDSKV